MYWRRASPALIPGYDSAYAAISAPNEAIGITPYY